MGTSTPTFSHVVSTQGAPAWNLHNDTWDIFLWAWPEEGTFVVVHCDSQDASQSRAWTFKAAAAVDLSQMAKPDRFFIHTTEIILVWPKANSSVNLITELGLLKTYPYMGPSQNHNLTSQGRVVAPADPPEGRSRDAVAKSHYLLARKDLPDCAHIPKEGLPTRTNWSLRILTGAGTERLLPCNPAWEPLGLHPTQITKPLVALRNPGESKGALNFRDTSSLSRLGIWPGGPAPYNNWSWTRLGGVLFGPHPKEPSKGYFDYSHDNTPLDPHGNKINTWLRWHPHTSSLVRAAWGTDPKDLQLCLEDSQSGNLWGYDPSQKSIVSFPPSPIIFLSLKPDWI